MNSTLAAVIEEKGSSVHCIEPTATVHEAVRKMNRERVGALLVTEHSRPVGIFTERDVLSRIVDPGRPAEGTMVAEVMTRELVTVRPTTSVEDAMSVVTEKRCRHLPVMDGQELLGMVSAGDLTRWMNRGHKVHIQDLVNYITGAYPV
jgi:CBS domain-containing protein